MRGFGSKGWLGVEVEVEVDVVVVGAAMVERRLDMAVSERASMNSFTMKSRLEKSSRVKLGPMGKTERGVDIVDALSGVMMPAPGLQGSLGGGKVNVCAIVGVEW